MRQASRIAVAVALLVVGLVGPAEAHAGGHCAYRLEPIARRGNVTTARLVPIGCFDTYARALQAGLGGSVALRTDLSAISVSEQDFSPQTATADVMIGTEWDGASYLQSSISYFASATCSSSNTWQVNNVGDTWNDRFESGKGFGGCDINKKFQHADFGGSVVTCTPNCTSYGTLANQVSSLRWKP